MVRWAGDWSFVVRSGVIVVMYRGRLEAEVEMLHKERLEQRCYSERLNQQTLFR